MNLNPQLFKRHNHTKSSSGQMTLPNSQWSFYRIRVLLLLSFLLIPAVGHCSISIMPMEAKLQVTRPGARLTNDIEVYNSSAAPIHVSGAVVDWSMTLEGQKQFHEAGTQPLSCAKWIQMNPIEFSLLPGKSMRVRYSVTPPSELSEEHHAIIFFTARALPKEGDNRFALNVQTRIGCKVLVTPTLKAVLQGKIAGMEFQTLPAPVPQPLAVSVRPVSDESPDASTRQSPPQSKVKVTFVNPNPVSVRLSGTVEARGADGQPVAQGKIMPAKALVLAGATRELWAQFDKPLPPGNYQIRAILDYGGKELVGGSLKATVKPFDVAPVQAAPEVIASE